MKPPRVNVALIIAPGPIRVHSPLPIVLETRPGTEVILNPGEISITMELQTKPEFDQWLLYAKKQQRSSAERWSQTASQGGCKVRTLSVGLTPSDGGWRTLEYWMLVQNLFPGAKTKTILSDRGLIDPDTQPVIMTLPRRQSLYEITVNDATGHSITLSDPIRISTAGTFTLTDAPVGDGFHWQHRENISVASPLWFDATSAGEICGGVEIELEDYVASVNSSEMPADSPLEFLKAQVIAARSWLLANWGSHHPDDPFTVCNGDHCQCYYGPSRVRESSRRAAVDTAGEILTFNGVVCDARYAKTCGGVTEPANTVWAFLNEPYLTHQRDLPDAELLDLSEETAFRSFQRQTDDCNACCAPNYAVFSGELDSLAPLYRWTETYTPGELREIISEKTEQDPGDVLNVQPLRRGPSGRIITLQVVGSKQELRLTPELEIRRALSHTHLPSSAFWVQRDVPGKFVFHGMGWGHGVGMCQMGAAALAASGWDYRRILEFYYPSTSIEKIY